MKKCPNCFQYFGDENDFCLNDGTPLRSDRSTQETVLLPTVVADVQTLPRQPSLVPSRRSGWIQYLVFGLILLLSVAAVGFGVAYFTTARQSPDDSKATSSASNAADDQPQRLREQQSRLDAENMRLDNEKKRLESDRKKLETQKQSSGPMPPSTSALIVDPPTNIRLTPNGKVQCVVGSSQVVKIAMSPGIPDKNGVWYRTTACGASGLVHSSQLSFTY